ncbi:MAG: 3-oxoacyl-[acyl-carrier protein] reductase [Pirellulaceae bacterium]|jgi:3-oxoacyl-[acyl-carrier protein] reductase
MRKRGGSIVLVSSAEARIGLPNREAIAAAKAGVISLMQSAAASYTSRGIRFNAVPPGLVKTHLTERIYANEKSAAASDRCMSRSDLVDLMMRVNDPLAVKP